MREAECVEFLKRIREFLKEDSGILSSVDYILLTTIVVISSVVGLATIRDRVTQEFGDLSLALENLQQNYTVSMTFTTITGGTTVQRFGYTEDNAGYLQANDPSTVGVDANLIDVDGVAPAQMDLTIVPDAEEG